MTLTDSLIKITKVLCAFTIAVAINAAAAVTTMSTSNVESSNLLSRRALAANTTARVTTWSANISLSNSLRETTWARIAIAVITTRACNRDNLVHFDEWFELIKMRLCVELDIIVDMRLTFLFNSVIQRVNHS